MASIQGIEYDKKGKVVHSWENEDFSYKRIIPETFGDAYFNAFCYDEYSGFDAFYDEYLKAVGEPPCLNEEEFYELFYQANGSVDKFEKIIEEKIKECKIINAVEE